MQGVQHPLMGGSSCHAIAFPSQLLLDKYWSGIETVPLGYLLVYLSDYLSLTVEAVLIYI